jgi:hypothetical protein
MKTVNKPTPTGWPFPGERVMCRAANNGKGLRILLHQAQQERRTSHVCGGCAARPQCDAHHVELSARHQL